MPDNRILLTMLDRLYASLTRGPAINCQPHRSRQRIDLTALSAFEDAAAVEVIKGLLGEDGRATVRARVAMPASLINQPRGFAAGRRMPAPEQVAESPEDAAAERAWRRQQKLLTKLRNLSEDARTYEQDTGVHALYLGYPVLSLPPGTAGRTRRILAPVAFVPVSLDVSTGQRPGIVLRAQGEGADRVQPNAALLAWLERESGDPIEELFDDQEGTNAYRELRELIEQVVPRAGLDGRTGANLSAPETLAADPLPLAESLPSGAALLPGAVLGLFPASKQGLVRDTRALIAAPDLTGPLRAFVDVEAALAPSDAPPEASEAEQESAADSAPAEAAPHAPRRFVEERLVARADPFQARAVARARTCRGLVIHGPPGTGKSQTITNIIGDHLARGERVLFVCEKRTALDVVANRLEHLGLDRLVAVVHDPKRDQRRLYMSIRASLDELPELQTAPQAPRDLAQIDRQLAELHEELRTTYGALQDEAEDGAPSFHELVGRWLDLEAPSIEGLDELQLPLADLTRHSRDVDVILDRGAGIGYATSPWAAAAGGTLDQFLSRQMKSLRRGVASAVEDARIADVARDPRIAPFDARPLLEQAALRRDLGVTLADVRALARPGVRARVGPLDAPGVRMLVEELAATAAARPALEQPLDRELAFAVSSAPPTLPQVNTDIAALKRYLKTASRWWGFLAFGARGEAGRVLGVYGLARDPEAAERVLAFLTGLRARLLLTATLGALRGGSGSDRGKLRADDELAKALGEFEATLALVTQADESATVPDEIRRALTDDIAAEDVAAGLAAAPERAEALHALEVALARPEVFDDAWLTVFRKRLREGGEATPTLAPLETRFDDIDPVLRVREGLATLPAALGLAIERVLVARATAEDGRAAIERRAIERELETRVERDETLRRIDGRRLELALRRYAVLEGQKRITVRAAILHLWTTRQQERLLASTGTRLNSDGAALRRRLFVRGKRAMRLRQMIAAGGLQHGSEEGGSHGATGDGANGDATGDPLFEMCPVWMASPEAVAQVFAREPLFDVVIFDEASQCRLEEALPVLTRAHRAVIAGDPKQLPPSRFFETSISTSDDDELETDQDLFEAQQGDVEDLLAAALNLDVEESYLDVHYRSQNADLIRFSNEQFYRSRLQAIPGHPKNRARVPPIRLDRVEGIYEDRSNPAEAERVAQIVDDLLRRADPPSIGIACFNLKQRDLIRDVLDERAQSDAAFARRLAAARERRGEGSFEGLFVKNLESVQGDERDHLIISTTYGPAPDGKFRQNFGPLNMAGGGRRLNVLVTRARAEIHLVTSIPRERYAALEPLPPGKSPNGRWLLYAYLHYADVLAAEYALANEILDAAVRTGAPRLVENPIAPPSLFAKGLGARLAGEHAIGSDVHWGNVGFCVDAALHHPERLEDVTAGVLTDFARYPGAPDPVEWEVFRTGMLESQGWSLVRVWSPLFFRDPERQFGRITAAAAEALAEGDADHPTAM